MARLIGCQLLFFHLSLPCPDPTFTGAQRSCDLYYNFVAALRWKDSSLEIAAFQRWLSFSNSKVQNFHMEDTHVLSINYCQLLNSVVSLDSNKLNWAVWLGWRSGSFHKPLTPRNRAGPGGEEWQPCGSASHKWPGRGDLWGITTSQVHWQGKPLPQQGNTRALSTFLCLLQSLQITFPIFTPHLTTSPSCARSGAKSTLLSNRCPTRSTWGGTGL